VNPSTEQKRRRRRPEDARREILDAAHRLLLERPAKEVTVGAIMEATTLSRKSFYVYFDNRYDLLRRLVEPLAAERDAIIAPLLAPGVDMATGAREAPWRRRRARTTRRSRRGATSSSRSSKRTRRRSPTRSTAGGSGGSRPSRPHAP
jgi:AcrR family transcriptional regulator